MKAIVVMYDSLNRQYLSAYGCDWTHTPNFARLAERCCTFDNHFVGSLPCIPARRELHTGRYNFLHRGWGPLEPFDDSMPQILKQNGVYTHLATDHMHYFEEGGATYHQRYSSWEVARGQEGDPCKANVTCLRPTDWSRYWHQDRFNRTQIESEDDFPITQTFSNGIQFLNHNHAADRWLLTVETFDPHEPFHAPDSYKDLYRHLCPEGFDWPDWPGERYTPDENERTRYAYAALVSMCDANLGRLLDAMDRYALWDDTMLILTTDHGYLLGEHGGVGKVPQPYYRQVCNIPLMVWDPRSGATGRRQALTQAIDIAPTLLDYFGVPIPGDMLGRPLAQAVAEDAPVRDTALFGVHGQAVYITDGRYILGRMPRDEGAAEGRTGGPVYDYTLMPTHMHDFFSLESLAQAELAPPFSFTKGLRTLRVPSDAWLPAGLDGGDLLYDTVADPAQDAPVDAPDVAARLLRRMGEVFAENDAPKEAFARYGVEG